MKRLSFVPAVALAVLLTGGSSPAESWPGLSESRSYFPGDPSLPDLRILAIGDSLIAGTYVEQLWRKVPPRGELGSRVKDRRKTDRSKGLEPEQPWDESASNRADSMGELDLDLEEQVDLDLLKTGT